MKKAIYPGSFDPITNGHLDIITKASKLCDELHVVIFDNISKSTLFNLNDRLDMLRSSVSHLNNVKIHSSNSLVVDYCKEFNINVIIRGIRNYKDFEFEFDLSVYNSKINEDVQTIFIPSNLNNKVVSSSIIKELLNYNQDISEYVPKMILNDILRLYRVKILNT